jgi:hypothetical protein
MLNSNSSLGRCTTSSCGVYAWNQRLGVRRQVHREQKRRTSASFLLEHATSFCHPTDLRTSHDISFSVTSGGSEYKAMVIKQTLARRTMINPKCNPGNAGDPRAQLHLTKQVQRRLRHPRCQPFPRRKNKARCPCLQVKRQRRGYLVFPHQHSTPSHRRLQLRLRPLLQCGKPSGTIQDCLSREIEWRPRALHPRLLRSLVLN